jgi:hypothetical protein
VAGIPGRRTARLLTANAIAATLTATQLDTALTFPQVRRVGTNDYAETSEDFQSTLTRLQSNNALADMMDWNITKIRANEVWSTFGIRGAGAVVGIVDTGVLYTHSALVDTYRGNLGGGNFDHNYNWFDFFDGKLVPYDDNGHGTFGTGIVIGDGGPGYQIGIAPDAQWIAYRALDGGGGTAESLHAGLEWMLAPTDLTGNNPQAKLAPQVVLNMWHYNACDHSFAPDLAALRAANILPIFAPGSKGPGCVLVAYPAASPDALSAGATDSDDLISGFSARGPSCEDGAIKPDLAAPGVNIRSCTLNGGYDAWSGTSFSTAHLAGAAALLFSADSRITIDELEQTLFETAVCHDNDLICGGELCPGANNAYGYGRIDVFEAVSLTMSTYPPYDVPWLIAGPLVVELQPGSNVYVPVIFDATDLLPGTYHAGIAIESNDPHAPFTLLPVSLAVTDTCQPLSGVFASFTPTEPFVGEVVTFTAIATGTLPISYAWDFGDGSFASGSVVIHTFDASGIHIVKLTIENPCDQVEMKIQITMQAIIRRFLLPIITR